MVPESIGRLKRLKYLYLYNNNIKFLSSTIDELTTLEALYISHNRLTELPATTTMLGNIKKLDISNNRLTKLPQDIFELEILCQLNIEDCFNIDIDKTRQKLNNNSKINIYTWRQYENKS